MFENIFSKNVLENTAFQELQLHYYAGFNKYTLVNLYKDTEHGFYCRVGEENPDWKADCYQVPAHSKVSRRQVYTSIKRYNEGGYLKIRCNIDTGLVGKWGVL